jgi:hypothetical protein
MCYPSGGGENMQTERISAWQVEVDDYLSLGTDYVWQVVEVLDDKPDTIGIVLKDEDGETHPDNPLWYIPWENLTLITSFEDDADAYYV